MSQRHLFVAAVTLTVLGCASMSVTERWEPHAREWRDAFPVASAAIEISADDLEVLDRTPIVRMGSLVVVQPVELNESEFTQWVNDRAAEIGGTHWMAGDDLQAMGAEALAAKSWLGDVRIEERDRRDGATLFVVFQVRRSRWLDLPEPLQPTPR